MSPLINRFSLLTKYSGLGSSSNVPRLVQFAVAFDERRLIMLIKETKKKEN